MPRVFPWEERPLQRRNGGVQKDALLSRSLFNAVLTMLDVFFRAVYPQKQQYAYGYAYPGPYAYGSQYGPYNY